MRRVAAVIGCERGAANLPSADRAAVALTLSWSGAEVTVFAADPEALYYARAAGALAQLADERLDLAGFDVIMFGRGGCGEEGDLFPARVAEQHAASLLFDVVEIEPDADGLNVTRDLGRGARDLLHVRGALVLSIADSAARGDYVSRYRIDRARRADPATAPHRQASTLDWRRATPRVRLGDHAARVAGRAVDRMNALFGLGSRASDASSVVQGDAEDCARQLYRYLCHNGFVRDDAAEESSAVVNVDALERSGARANERPAFDRAVVSARVLRRTRPLTQVPRGARGPFRIGVDIDAAT